MPLENRHVAGRSWMLAMVYFAACWVLAVLGDVTQLFGDPLGGDATRRPVFWALWLVALVAAYTGYWVIWPKGTYTDGRRWSPLISGFFGLVHGVSEGILYVVLWMAMDEWLAGTLPTVLFTVLGIGAFNALWRTFLWDVWVTPPHNVDSWNMRKVLLVHLPVLGLAVTHLTVYRSVVVFLSVEIVALVGAAIHMRFPSPAADRWSSGPI